MTLGEAFDRLFRPMKRDAAAAFVEIEHVAATLVHQAEKDLDMPLPQTVTDALARIKALLSSGSDQSSADAKTISDLKDANTALAGQVTDLGNQLQTVTGQRDDAVSQLQDLEQQLLAIAPPPAA